MELLKKYGPLVLIIIGPLLVALVAILAPEMFDRVVESLGLLFGGIASGLGMATVRRRPKTGDSDAGFITLQALVLILAAAMLITLLAGCPGPTR
ncbi:hypothetical protein KAW64_17315, partial [bacterium]|nr:hypothetical protein [bacterium]